MVCYISDTSPANGWKSINFSLLLEIVFTIIVLMAEFLYIMLAHMVWWHNWKFFKLIRLNSDVVMPFKSSRKAFIVILSPILTACHWNRNENSAIFICISAVEWSNLDSININLKSFHSIGNFSLLNLF